MDGRMKFTKQEKARLDELNASGETVYQTTSRMRDEFERLGKKSFGEVRRRIEKEFGLKSHDYRGKMGAYNPARVSTKRR